MVWDYVCLVSVDFLWDVLGGRAESAGVHNGLAFAGQFLNKESCIYCLLKLVLGRMIQINVETLE